MALEASLRRFVELREDVNDIFYVTTPPRVFLQLMERGELHLGNLCISVAPDIVIGPDNVLEGLVAKGAVTAHQPFMQSRANVLLVKKNNPKGLHGIEDLLRDDVALFMSNPTTEVASFQVYSQTLASLAELQGLDPQPFHDLASGASGRTVFGEQIHHRETPQCLANGQADAAIVYYHLALRYTRIFPDEFEFIALGSDGGIETPGNRVTRYHFGLAGGPAPAAKDLLDFMLGPAVGEIYEAHGLRRPD